MDKGGKFFIGLFLSLLLGMGLVAFNKGRFFSESQDMGMEHAGLGTQPTPALPSASPVPNSGMQMGQDVGAVLAGSRIDLQNSENLKPGNVRFSFMLYAKSGQLLGDADLKVAHEKKVHFIVVRDDLREFQHIHPAFANGMWSVNTTIPVAGDYQLYVDIQPIQEEAVVLRVPVRISGATINPKFPELMSGLVAVSGDVQTNLDIQPPILVQKETNLVFALTRNNQPVKNLDPYLGAFGHVVMLQQGDPNAFYHVHPVTETQPQDGKVQFVTVFPTKGRYTLFAQFNVGGEIKTFPITVGVANNDSIPSRSPMEGGERIIHQ